MITNISNGYTQDILVKKVEIFSKLYKNFPKNKIIKEMKEVAEANSVPLELLIGIYMIEVTFRPFWFRCIENIIIFYKIMLWFLFKREIPNYTVGRFQLGLGVISTNGGYPVKIHSRKFSPKNINHIFIIINSLKWKKNLKIAGWWISQLYSETTDLGQLRKLRYIGIKYNGYISYGLLLESLVVKIRKKIDED
jgi:hypothetical protein